MGDEILERNKNLNRGFRKLLVWREAVELYAFEKKVLGEVKGLPFKIRDQVLGKIILSLAQSRQDAKREG